MAWEDLAVLPITIPRSNWMCSPTLLSCDVKTSSPRISFGVLSLWSLDWYAEFLSRYLFCSEPVTKSRCICIWYWSPIGCVYCCHGIMEYHGQLARDYFVSPALGSPVFCAYSGSRRMKGEEYIWVRMVLYGIGFQSRLTQCCYAVDWSFEPPWPKK